VVTARPASPSTRSGARPDPTAVRRAVDAVPDPELPPVTIGMLGMVHHLTVTDDGDVEVELLPTYSGCPATAMIEQDVVTAVAAVAGVAQVRVRWRYEPLWTADRIDAEGREQLRRFGIAPPGGPIERAIAPEGRPTLPLAFGGTAAATGAAEPRPCPYCGSTDTSRDTAFGPTPCRDLRTCHACHQPFEAFKR
jgi:ring-1,2-phenylacetyl-CoA epoxidase subunit PaaD